MDLSAPDPLSRLYQAFETAHERLNGHTTGAPAKIVNLRVVHRAHRPAVSVGAEPPLQAGLSQKGRRPAFFPGTAGWLGTPIHDRALLAKAERLAGPAIIEQPDSTTLVPPGWSAEVLTSGGLLLTRTT